MKFRIRRFTAAGKAAPAEETEFAAAAPPFAAVVADPLVLAHAAFEAAIESAGSEDRIEVIDDDGRLWYSHGPEISPTEEPNPERLEAETRR